MRPTRAEKAEIRPSGGYVTRIYGSTRCRRGLVITLLSIVLAACSPTSSTPTDTPLPSATTVPVATPTPTPPATPATASASVPTTATDTQLPSISLAPGQTLSDALGHQLASIVDGELTTSGVPGASADIIF